MGEFKIFVFMLTLLGAPDLPAEDAVRACKAIGEAAQVALQAEGLPIGLVELNCQEVVPEKGS